ncbi:hypothetical protein KCP76_13920 [Salmonella enterica subsp. enterica serovar Weltevreden]|nr:hypothetical protein KCP76_13920 [Salmonella enterica subsp. enterica serovar Weltevreden]
MLSAMATILAKACWGIPSAHLDETDARYAHVRAAAFLDNPAHTSVAVIIARDLFTVDGSARRCRCVKSCAMRRKWASSALMKDGLKI